MGHIGPNFNAPRQHPPSSTPMQAGGATGGLPTSSPVGAGSALPTPSSAGAAQSGLFSLAPLFAFENMPSPREMVALLRNLLQMPREMVQLLALLSKVDTQSAQQLLKTLLAENPKIPLDELQQLILTNAKESQGKLIQLLQSSQMTKTGTAAQMGELMNTLTQLIAQAKGSPADALQTTLALYLPYFPLPEPQKFSLGFEDWLEGESGADDAQLVLFIETRTLGLFKINLAQEATTCLRIRVEHDSEACLVQPQIQQQADREMLQGSGHQISWEWLLRQARPADSEDSTLANANSGRADSTIATPEQGLSAGQSVGIHPGGGVSIGVIHAAYVLIRVVLEQDNRQTLGQARQVQL